MGCIQVTGYIYIICNELYVNNPLLKAIFLDKQHDASAILVNKVSSKYWILFVCVEVLQPSQPKGVMSSTVSLPNHTFTEQA